MKISDHESFCLGFLTNFLYLLFVISTSTQLNVFVYLKIDIRGFIILRVLSDITTIR